MKKRKSSVKYKGNIVHLEYVDAYEMWIGKVSDIEICGSTVEEAEAMFRDYIDSLES